MNKRIINGGLALLLACACALPANAKTKKTSQCVNPSQMLGTWNIFQGDGLFTDSKDAVSAAQALDAGQKTLQEVTRGAQPDPGETRVTADGKMVIFAATEQAEPPMVIKMMMTASWKMDCNVMTVQMQSLDRFSVTYDERNVSAAQKEEIRKTQDMLGQASKDPEFKKPQRSKILFAGNSYILTEDLSSQSPGISLLKKK